MPVARSHPILTGCVTRALDTIGDRWTLLILRDAFLGVRRFERWQQHLRIPRQLLADRLRRLVADRLLDRTRYQVHPPRYEYRLTPMGRDLYPLALMIRRWERHWGAGVDAMVGEVALLHRSCGARIEPDCVCANCGETVNALQVAIESNGRASADGQVWARRLRRSSTVAARSPGSSLFLHDAIDILGDRWTYLVLIAAFRQVRRFSALTQTLGISTNILSDRLTRLLDARILRHVTSYERLGIYEYELTEKGLDLFPVIATLLQWGERWLPGSDEAPLLMRHQLCRRRLIPRIVCDHCGGALRSLEVDYQWPRPAEGANRRYRYGIEKSPVIQSEVK